MEKIKISTESASICAILNSKTIETHYQYKIPIKRGKYEIILKTKGLEQRGFLEVKKDDYLLFGDTLFDPLDEEIDGGANLYKKGCNLSIGYDGIFNIFYKIKKVSKIPENDYYKAINIAKKEQEKLKEFKVISINDIDRFSSEIRKSKDKLKKSKAIRKYSQSIIIHDILESINLIKLQKLNDLTESLINQNFN